MQPNGPQFPQPQYQAPPPQQPIAASQMKKGFNKLWILVILLLLALIGLGVFTYTLFTENQDYKNNLDEKVNARIDQEVDEAEEAKEAEFIEREKEPLVEYKGPAPLGSVVIKYPKTWSAFVTESGRGSVPLDGYFHPNFVPGIDSGTAFALHLEVLEEDYASTLDRFSSSAERGEVRITAIKAPKVPSVTGSRIDGQIDKDRKGSIVLFPLRDKTLRLTLETEQFINDFNNIILANLVFTP